MSGSVAGDPAAVPNGLRLSPRPRYLSIAFTSLQQAVAYRASTIMTMLASLVWVMVLYHVWDSVYGGRNRLAGYTWTDMRTYILVAYSVNALLSFRAVGEMTWTIRSGRIATELTRPADYLAASFARASGQVVIEGLLGGSLALVLGVVVLDAHPPASPAAALGFGLAVVLGFGIKFLIHYLVALLCFVTTNAVGLIWAETAVVSLLSGALVPLAFFPGPMRTVLAVLPFQGIVATPVGIYLGRLDGLDLVTALGVQLVWVIALTVAARLLWRPSIRALDIQGG
jgi:ABC-2 type transport system permease protein